MSVARQYILVAAEGEAKALEGALTNLAQTVSGLSGCQGVEILRDLGHPKRFVFIEKWATVEAHKRAGGSLPRDVLEPVMAALADKPAATYLDYLWAK